MNNYSDMTLTCGQCGKEFTFSEDEQEFYKSKGYTAPHRCKECRSTRRHQEPAVCSRCGNKFVEGAPVYCAACQVDVQLEFELKTKELRSAIDEAKVKLDSFDSEKALILAEASEKLSGAESEKVRLAELLAQKDELVGSLEQRLKNAGRELEKVSQNQASLNWLEPTLNSLKEKLAALESNQNNLIEALLQLVERNEEEQKNVGLFEFLKGFFHRRYPAHG